MITRATHDRLSESELAAIAWAESDESSVALARRLSRPYDAVVQARRRLRQHGFACPVFWTMCRICEQPLAGRTSRQLVHLKCRDARNAGYSRRRYHALKAADISPFHQLTPGIQARSLARLHHATDRDQRVTEASADRARQRWTDADDAFLLAEAHRPARDVALELGRTLWSVKRRRSDLRRQDSATGAEPARPSWNTSAQAAAD